VTGQSNSKRVTLFEEFHSIISNLFLNSRVFSKSLVKLLKVFVLKFPKMLVLPSNLYLAIVQWETLIPIWM